MLTFLLQEWTTIKVDKSIANITQGANGWLALPEVQDVIFWIDCRGMNPGGVSTNAIQIFLETAPAPEESLFVSMTSATLTAQNGGGPVIPPPKVLLNQNPSVPFATWMRWRLNNGFSPTSSWGGTFRVRVAANATTKYHK